MGKWEPDIDHRVLIDPKVKTQNKTKFRRTCLGSDCKEVFETTNRFHRLCYHCRKAEVFKYGSQSSDDFHF